MERGGANLGLKTTRMLVAGIGVAACTAVQAADPLPDSFTLAGVTLYATLDVGYAYQSEGVPLSGKYLGGLEYQAFTTTRNFSGSQSTLAESGIEQSKVGIRVDLPVGYDVNMVGRVETGFNPLSGELTDACGSIVDNAGIAQGKQTANADSSRCGQAFNGPAFGGLSHKVYGTLTIGRQQSLQLDALAVYQHCRDAVSFEELADGAGVAHGAPQGRTEQRMVVDDDDPVGTGRLGLIPWVHIRSLFQPHDTFINHANRAALRHCDLGPRGRSPVGTKRHATKVASHFSCTPARGSLC
jgi:hypothetical protein